MSIPGSLTAARTAAQLVSSGGAVPARARSSRFLPFPEAKEYMQSCGVKLQRYVEFRAWSKAGLRPRQIPSHPEVVYANDGWDGYPDFLGYERWMTDSRRPVNGEAGYEPIPSPYRDAMVKRGTAHDSLLQRLKHSVPDFEVRRLSSRWPSIILLRKRESADGDSQTSQPEDEWVAAQVKFASLESRHTRESAGESVFHDVLQAESIGLIFMSNGASKIALQRCDNPVAGEGTETRISNVKIHLADFDHRAVSESIGGWWQTVARRSLREWHGFFGLSSVSCAFSRHDAATNEILQHLYEPLGLNVERIFPLDVCMQGNLMLSGVRCLQRVARLHVGQTGYIFDINKQSHRGSNRRGRGWRGDIQRHICVVVEEKADVGGSLVRGVFVFPHEFAFRSDVDSADVSCRGRMLVYPPFANPQNERSRLKQQEQLKYFVDFKESPKCKQMELARELLGL